jgi:membrane fusion protein (multidrug efflux system)
VKRLLIVLAAAGCGKDAAPSGPAPTPGPAIVVHVGDAGVAGDAAPSKGWIGVIAAAQLVDVAPQLPGVIAQVKVRPGDTVKAGDVLVEMDPTSMQDQLRAAQASVSAAQAAYTQAIVDVQDAKRRLKLETQAVKDGVSPRQNVEEARLSVKRNQAAAEHAAATVAAERARLDSARAHVADTALKATFDGTVSNRFHDDGATVQAGEPIVRIVRQEGLRLKFAVPPDSARALAIDAPVVATVDTVAAPVPAVIRQISPALDPASQLIFVEAEPTVPLAPGLRPGLGAWVRTP